MYYATVSNLYLHIVSPVIYKKGKQKKRKKQYAANSIYCTVCRKLFHLQTLWVRSNTESEKELKTVIPMNESLSERENETDGKSRVHKTRKDG